MYCLLVNLLGASALIPDCTPTWENWQYRITCYIYEAHPTRKPSGLWSMMNFLSRMGKWSLGIKITWCIIFFYYSFLILAVAVDCFRTSDDLNQNHHRGLFQSLVAICMVSCYLKTMFFWNHKR
jgi:hypothetical protein